MRNLPGGEARDNQYERYLRARHAKGARTGPSGGRRSQGTGSGGGRSRGARIRRPLVATVGAMSALVLAATGLLWGVNDYAMAKVERVRVFQDLGDRPPPSEGVNILLVGSDRRAGLPPETRRKLNVGRSPGRRSDTMILAHISPDDNRAVLISLPRDWYVTIPAHTGEDGERVAAQQRKLNAAFSMGGADLTVDTVEQNTGVRIDHYMEASFLGFVRVVEAIGGVDVCVPKPVDDPKSGLTLPAGKSHLNGVQALQYVRARKTLGTGSDLGRIDRQQKFLGAMMQQALSTNTLLNPVKFTDFLNAALAAVTVDRSFSSGDLRRLAMIGRGLDPERMSFITVPVADPGYRTDGGELAVLADEKKARQLFDRVRQDEPVGAPVKKDGESNGADGSSTAPRVTVPPERIEVEVYNDTDTAGLAARAARDLRERGFLLEGLPRNAEPPNAAKTTVIQYGPNRGDSARTLAAALPGAQLKRAPELRDNVQVVVGSSYDGARDVQAGAGSAAGGSAPGGSASGPGLDPRSATAEPCQ